MNVFVSAHEYFLREQDKGVDRPVSERCIELELARRYFEEHGESNVLEVGAVTEQYGFVNHTAIDLCTFEKVANNVLMVDGEKFDYNGTTVLSISTIEHFGDLEFQEKSYDPLKPLRTFLNIHKLAKSYLITVPLNYTRYIKEDRHVLDIFFENYYKYYGVYCYSRDNKTENWTFHTRPIKEIFKRSFGEVILVIHK